MDRKCTKLRARPKVELAEFISPSSSSAMASILRRQLSAPVSNGHGSFILPCKKVRVEIGPCIFASSWYTVRCSSWLFTQLVIEYCEQWGSNRGMRDFLSKGDVVRLAERNPGVELVVRRVEHRHPHLRGVYSEPLTLFPHEWLLTYSAIPPSERSGQSHLRSEP